MMRLFAFLLAMAMNSVAFGQSPTPLDPEKLKQANALIEHIPSKSILDQHRKDVLEHLVDAETMAKERKENTEAYRQSIKLRYLIEIGRKVTDYRGLLALGTPRLRADGTYSMLVGFNDVVSQGESRGEFKLIYDQQGTILRIQSVFYNH
jgi:hypothetical protein